MKNCRGDEGNVTLLSIGVMVVSVLLILVVSAATAVHIQHARLLHLADELAIDAADAMDLPAFYAGTVVEPNDERAIDTAQSVMEAIVAEHLSDYAAFNHVDGARVIDVYAADSSTATVTVALTVRPLFGLEVLLPWTDGIELTATASARAY